MTNPTNLDETRIKTLFKEALVEVIEENQELVNSILIDALEYIGLSHAIEEGEKSKTVSRDEIFKVLSGELVKTEFKDSFLKDIRQYVIIELSSHKDFEYLMSNTNALLVLIV